MYTFCLFVIFLALFLSALNSHSVETKKREAINWSKFISQTFPFISKLPLLFSAVELKAEEVKENVATINEETETMTQLNGKIEPSLPHTSIA